MSILIHWDGEGGMGPVVTTPCGILSSAYYIRSACRS